MSRRRLSQAITALLAQVGFHRRGTRWYRTAGAAIDLVAVVTSKSGDTVRIELGVFDPVPYRRLWPIPKTITEADCIVRADLAHLGGIGRSWDPESDDDISAIVDTMRRQGLEWLNQMQTPEDRVAYLREHSLSLIPIEIIHLAHAEAQLGYLDDARHRLTALRSRTQAPFLDFLDAVIGRLGDKRQPSAETDPLAFLQSWFLDHTDGEWEHEFGITIESLDNPGWVLRVSLTGTDLEGAVLAKRELHVDRPSWVDASADGTQFEAAAGPLGLAVAIEEFRRFALANPSTRG